MSCLAGWVEEPSFCSQPAEGLKVEPTDSGWCQALAEDASSIHSQVLQGGKEGSLAKWLEPPTAQGWSQAGPDSTPGSPLRPSAGCCLINENEKTILAIKHSNTWQGNRETLEGEECGFSLCFLIRTEYPHLRALLFPRRYPEQFATFLCASSP